MIETVNSEVNFTPIPVTILIETQEEYNALLEARTKLWSYDIDREQFDMTVRDIWVKTLKVIACTAQDIGENREIVMIKPRGTVSEVIKLVKEI